MNMDIQKFYAKNTREGINKVKDILGENAIILGSRQHVKGVEIVATADSFNSKLEPFFDNKHKQVEPKVSVNQLAENATEDFNRFTHQAEQLTAKHKTPPIFAAKSEINLERNMQKENQLTLIKQENTLKENQMTLIKQENTLNELKHGLSGIKQLLDSQNFSSQVMHDHNKQTDRQILALRKELKAIQQEIDLTTKKSVRAQAPMVKSLKQDILRLRQSISQQQKPVIKRVRSEINSLKDNLQNQFEIAGWSRWSETNPTRASLLIRLAKVGLTKNIAERIIANINETDDKSRAWRQVLGFWAKEIAVTHDNIINNGGRIALVGPTGVGKTTTIAKLASKFITRHGENSVALISYDHYRIGAHDQLMTYGRLIGAPVITAVNRSELDEIITSLHHKKLILIDTAGMSPNNPGFKEHIQELMNNSIHDQMDHYLTISANTQYSALNKVIDNYSPLKIKAAILTKTDEATNFGDMISATMERRLPVAYITTGQTVPSDIEEAKVTNLISKSISLAAQETKEVNEEAMAQTYGPLVANL